METLGRVCGFNTKKVAHFTEVLKGETRRNGSGKPVDESIGT